MSDNEKCDTCGKPLPSASIYLGGERYRCFPCVNAGDAEATEVWGPAKPECGRCHGGGVYRDTIGNLRSCLCGLSFAVADKVCAACGKVKPEHIELRGRFYCYEFTIATAPDEAVAEFTTPSAVEIFLAENPRPTGAKRNRQDYCQMVSCRSLTALHDAYAPPPPTGTP